MAHLKRDPSLLHLRLYRKTRLLFSRTKIIPAKMWFFSKPSPFCPWANNNQLASWPFCPFSSTSFPLFDPAIKRPNGLGSSFWRGGGFSERKEKEATFKKLSFVVTWVPTWRFFYSPRENWRIPPPWSIIVHSSFSYHRQPTNLLPPPPPLFPPIHFPKWSSPLLLRRRKRKE